MDQSTGSPINGTKSITFSLYNTAIGGTPIYKQARQVTITNGTFSVYLGQGEGYYDGNTVADGIPAETFTEQSARYLGIWITDSSTEMTPRQLIASAAYAYKAEVANTVKGESMVTDSGNIGIGTTNPNEALTVEGAISLSERDMAPSVTDGYGKIYAKPPSRGLDNYATLLIHSHTTNNARVFTDSTGRNSITAYGDVKHSTEQKRFGATSIYFDGSTGYLSIPDSSDWDFGSDDFTVEMWIYPVANKSYAALIGQDWEWSLTLNNGVLYFWTSRTFGGNDHSYGGEALPLNQWYHVAMVRSNDLIRAYVNGIERASSHYFIGWFDVNSELVVGKGTGGPERMFNGYMDEILISKGIARWVTNFMPPDNRYGTAGLYYKNSFGEEIEIAGSAGGSASSLWGRNGENIYYNSGSVGIGTVDPQARLDIGGGDIKMGYQIIQKDCYNTHACIANCPGNKRLLSGGCRQYPENSAYLAESTVDSSVGDRWDCRYTDTIPHIRMRIICADIK